MKKRGFTLIELLAVIVILAIVALIAVPVIQSVIDVAKKGSFKSTSHGIVDAATYECSTAVLSSKEVTPLYTITNGSFADGTKLKIKGKLPEDGTVNVNEKCEVSIALHDEKWCASKSFSENEITISDYVDGSCGSTGASSLSDKLKNLTVGIQKGVNLGANEYDAKLVEYASDVDYYNSYYFTGLNPNNYIKVGTNTYRIVGVDSQGISVVGTSFSFDESNYATYGIITNAKMIISNDNPDNNAIYKNGINYSTYNNITTSVDDYLTFYDYDSTMDRQAFSTCIFNKNLEDYQERTYYANAFADCSQATWLSNLSASVDMKMKIFGDAGTSQAKSIYLNNGKMVIGEESYDFSGIACEGCVSYHKFYLRNDVQYVSGNGTSANPYTYKINGSDSPYTVPDEIKNNIYSSAYNYFVSLPVLNPGDSLCVGLQTLVDSSYITAPIKDNSNNITLSLNRTVTAKVNAEGDDINTFNLGSIGSTCN